MALTRVKFEEWYPDQPHLLGALKDAKNVIPTTTGYTYFNNAEACLLYTSDAADE